MKINFLDLFSGVGGFALGLERSGVEIGNHWFSEIDKFATAVYQKQFPTAKGLGDVTTIKSFSELGRIDLVTFGFPCQDLSSAGKRTGFDGKRSVLFYEATRIIRETRPTHFIFENVKGLLSHDDGRTFEKVLCEIADIGLYDCEWQLVNTCWFLPQNRERIYFVGHLRNASEPKVFPVTGTDSDDITSIEQIGNIIPESKYENPTSGRVYSSTGIAPTLMSNTGGNHTPKIITTPRGFNKGAESENCPTITTSRFEQNNFLCLGSSRPNAGKMVNKAPCLTANNAKGTGCVPLVMPILTPDRVNKCQNGRRIKPAGDPSFTLTTQDQHGVVIIPDKYYLTEKNIAHVNREFGSKAQDVTNADIAPTLTAAMGMGGGNVPYFNDDVAIRKLTPVECERLQGFPDNWTAGHSDSQRYKMMGNAVSVPIPEYIFKKLYRKVNG